ncbi:MAG: hypothetical protein AB7G65_19785 [Thermoleophilia bacterium]
MNCRLPLGAAGLALLCLAGPALGTEGSLYPVGVAAVVNHRVPDEQCHSRQDGAVFGVFCPPAAPSLEGAKWQLDLRTPWAGTVIESISWRAVRYHETATSIALEVLGDGNPVWGVAEQDIPRSPAAAKAYLVGLRSQSASLRLRQTETRQQPNRVWSIIEPTINVRDLEAPTLALRGLPGDWVTGGEMRVDWSAADNLGSDGIGQQRIRVGSSLKWAGAPGQGAHGVVLGLGDVPDGVLQVAVEADGDGTAPAATQTGVARIDRQAPGARVDVTPSGPDLVRLTTSVADATSGVRSWTVRAGGPEGPVVVSGAATGSTVEVPLGDYVSQGRSVAFHLTAQDNAGNVTTFVSDLVTRAAPGASSAVPTVLVGPDALLGEPGRIEASGAALPNFSRVQTLGLSSAHSIGSTRAGRRLVPVIVATYGKPVGIRGRFVHANRRGLRGATVYLLDPTGRTQATVLTDRRGRFRFTARPRRPGIWRAVALGRPLVATNAFLVVRPRVRTRVNARTFRPGETLRVSGVIRPRTGPRGKSVELQWRRGGEWRPLATSRSDRRGRFALAYRFTPAGGGYSVRLRVVVPRERGWRFAPVVASRFLTTVR